ncbi:MAG: hypothetical protein ACXV79_02595 [Methylobacter sp.]
MICTPINYTCFNLSEHLDGVNHDVVSNFLKQSRITAPQVWGQVQGLIHNTEDSFLIIDDSVQDKRYSKSIELVKTQYSGAVGGLVRGIGVVNLVHSDGQDTIILVDSELIITPPTARPRTTLLRTCSSTLSSTKDSRRRRCCSTVGMRPGKT